MPFTLHAPSSAGGQSLTSVRLIGGDGSPGALLTYGQGLGAVRVLESAASSSSAASSGGSVDGLSLPTRTIDGATATVLSTPLFTVLRFTSGSVSYTVLGSVTAAEGQTAAAQIAQSQ